MKMLAVWVDKAHRASEVFDPTTRAISVARLLLVIAQLSLLFTTPTTKMFIPVGALEPFSQCERRFLQFSAFCLFEAEIVRWSFVVLLVVIAIGFIPVITSWLHWYVSFSIYSTISVPDGGDQAIVNITFWLAIIALSDRRWSSWTKKQTVDVRLRKLSWSGSWALRLQMAFIYFQSSMWKLPVDQWEQGSAVYNVVRMEGFGATGQIGELIRWLTSYSVISLILTWGTIWLEFIIAISLLGNAKAQRVALICALLIHGGIIVTVGLFSFGLIMIGGVFLATSQAWMRVCLRKSTDSDTVPALYRFPG